MALDQTVQQLITDLQMDQVNLEVIKEQLDSMKGTEAWNQPFCPIQYHFLTEGSEYCLRHNVESVTGNEVEELLNQELERAVQLLSELQDQFSKRKGEQIMAKAKAKASTKQKETTATDEKVAKAPRKKVEGPITIVFTDTEITKNDPRTARKWLRDNGLSVKDAHKDEEDASVWYFDEEAPEVLDMVVEED